MVSLIYGGITHHYMAPSLNYCNTINNVGTIHNEYVIAMAGNKDFKLGILKGKDSACGNIVGPVSSFRLDENVDFMLGGYNANLKTFEKRGMIPPHFNGITPIVGFNFKIPLVKTESFEMNLNNLVSIGIITHAISVDF